MSILDSQSQFNDNMTVSELLKILADHHHERLRLADTERASLITLLKKKGEQELEYGQEIEYETVRLIKRVTGAMGIYFN